MEWNHSLCSRADVINAAGSAFGMSQDQTLFPVITWYKSTIECSVSDSAALTESDDATFLFVRKNTDISKLPSAISSTSTYNDYSDKENCL